MAGSAMEKVDTECGVDLLCAMGPIACEEGASIPVKYTCDGPDVSPPLSWSGVPEDADSLVLIVDRYELMGRYER